MAVLLFNTFGHDYCLRKVFEAKKSRNSSVGIALSYGLDHRGSRVRFPAGLGIFLFTTAVFRTALGLTQPPIQWVQGLFPWG
jgi:hypothetical protein